MSGGNGGVIILKLVKDALKVSVSPSGKYKLWHALCATHALVFVAGCVVARLI